MLVTRANRCLYLNNWSHGDLSTRNLVPTLLPSTLHNHRNPSGSPPRNLSCPFHTQAQCTDGRFKIEMGNSQADNGGLLMTLQRDLIAKGHLFRHVSRPPHMSERS